MKKKLLIIFIALVVLHILFRVYSYRSEYLTPYNAKYWENRYLRSQWVIPLDCSDQKLISKDRQWCNINKATYKQQILLGDDGLYIYAGWEYIHGRNPTSLNAETPPFGKYLIGLSIILGNQNIFALLSGLLVLISLFLLNKQVVKDNFLAFLPVALFSFEPLFYTQLRAPFLDLLYLGLLLLVFFFVLRRQYILSAIFFGLMVSTKSSATTFILVALTVFLYLYFSKQFSEIKKFFLSLPITIAVFILTYMQLFLTGHSFRAFLGVQKWIINFYSTGATGSLIVPWQMLLTGKWSTWWGSTITVSEWHIGWSILFLSSFYFIYRFFKNKKWGIEGLFIIWIITYLIFLSNVPVWPRYLLLVLPFMYNLTVWGLLKDIQRF